MDTPLTQKLLRDISLRQLQIFNAINRQGSFTRAAEELSLTQPTVSIQIKKLEQNIGSPLFEHVGKQLYLTDVGKILKNHARQILENLESLEIEIADLHGLKSGVLRLAVVSTAKYFAPAELGRFCDKYPGVDVELAVANRENLLRRMADNLDDLYIMARPPESEDVKFEPYRNNPLVVLAPSNHPLANEKNINPSLLTDYRMIVREPGSGTRLAVDEFFREHGIVLNTRMELGSNEAIKQAVMANLGISILSHHVMREEEEHGRLKILDVDGFPIQWQWYVGYVKGKQLSAIAQAYLEFINAEEKIEQSYNRA